MEYLPGLPQDTKPLRSCSGNRGKMLLKSHLGIKCHLQYNKVIRLLQPIVNRGDWGCIVCGLETIIVLVLLALNFIPQRLHHSLTFTRSRLRDSATVTLTPSGGTTAIKWSHRHNRLAYFPEYKKALRCIGGTITAPKHCPAALLTWH